MKKRYYKPKATKKQQTPEQINSEIKSLTVLYAVNKTKDNDNDNQTKTTEKAIS